MKNRTMSKLPPIMGAILGALLSLYQPAFASGTIPVALVQQFSSNGVPLAGCLLSLFVTGTVASPQIAFQDTGLTQALPWPVVCDANGRLPMFYLPDGSIHARLTDSSGLVQFDYPNMLVIGPSGGGGGGGGTIDPTTIATSGDVKFRPTAENLTGWVKLNGTTIGSGASGATQRANADTQGLYVYLWTNCPDSNCPVSTGRGASALADFNANKPIALLDWRGRAPLGLDTMGASAANRLTGGLFASGNATTAQSTGGGAAITLAQSNLPNVTLGAGTLAASAPTITATFGTGSAPTSVITTASATTGTSTTNITASAPGISGATASINGNTGQTAFNILSPFMLGTFYMKL